MEPFDRGGNVARVRSLDHHGPGEGGGWRLRAEVDATPRHFLEGVARILERAARALSERPRLRALAEREGVRVPEQRWTDGAADLLEGAAALRAIVERRAASSPLRAPATGPGDAGVSGGDGLHVAHVADEL